MFHETFPLSRAQISQVLLALASQSDSTDATSTSRKELLRQRTPLGNNQIKAMPRYSQGCGLLDWQGMPSTFGNYALNADPQLDQPSTQWLMHFHLSAPSGPGPLYWHAIVANRFRTGNQFRASDAADEIAACVERAEGKRLASGSLSSTATAFLGSYAKPEGLGRLGLLNRHGRDEYEVLPAGPPPVWAAACALLAYWSAQYGERRSINLDDLSAAGGFGDLLMMNAEQVSAVLRALQQKGYVEVHRVAPPYQVFLLQRDPVPLLAAMYGSEP